MMVIKDVMVDNEIVILIMVWTGRQQTADSQIRIGLLELVSPP